MSSLRKLCNEGYHKAEGEAWMTNSTETQAFGRQVGINRDGPEYGGTKAKPGKPAYWSMYGEQMEGHLDYPALLF